MELRFHPHRFTIPALLSLCLFACDPAVFNGIGGTGGTGATIGSGGSGSSVVPEECRSTALGRSTPVTFHIRNTGTADLAIPDGECNWVAWSLTSPDGGRLPSEYDVMCDGSSTPCPGICDGMGNEPFPAGTETTLVWEGILSQEADRYETKYCPAMLDDESCSLDCQRLVDAAPGSYTFEVRAFDVDDEDFRSPIVKTVTFDYPEQTDVDVVFP